MLSETKKSTEKQSLNEWFNSYVQETKNDTEDIFKAISSIPTYKFIIQFLVSLLVTIIYTADVDFYQNLIRIVTEQNSISRNLISTVCFTLIQVLCFYLLFRKNIKWFFKKISWRQIKWAFYFSVVALLISMSIALLITKSSYALDSNPSIEDQGIVQVIKLIIGLLGEEILFFSTFFLVLSLCLKKNFKKRMLNLYVSILFSCLVFGLAHLWTYDFNIVQCLIVIGLPSAIKVILYLWSKNLWCTYLQHFMYDFIVFLLVIMYSYS
ncbi:CPBP family intramembrane glutamic endopeptidase [Priestia endophytica]|uniref:CAAX protease self-immunity n=1 Tax=Priestia endophytica DSM 13796 TaxID=1121089 RepID=A0A1I6C0M8_9BACI|nr:CPBP family intramembrane glutamic endopeptidase [Priestia endophytica]KYG33415.1 hypothetical protein AZF06_21460 [Priestia endophytica]SFQ86743.1 CAAX protease self-immunity [Priestia endophytica DSM 13796]